jgi:hypothetical protein
MKRTQVSKTVSTRLGAKVRPPHASIGTWEEEQNPIDATTVVYRIAVRGGAFVVSGVDESDRTALEISEITWNGKQLRFVSLYRPTKHKASHVFRLTAKDRASLTVTYSDEEGRWTSKERWRKRSLRASRHRK